MTNEYNARFAMRTFHFVVVHSHNLARSPHTFAKALKSPYYHTRVLSLSNAVSLKPDEAVESKVARFSYFATVLIIARMDRRTLLALFCLQSSRSHGRRRQNRRTSSEAAQDVRSSQSSSLELVYGFIAPVQRAGMFAEWITDQPGVGAQGQEERTFVWHGGPQSINIHWIYGRQRPQEARTED